MIDQMFTKKDMFGFAEYYGRMAHTDMTLEEMLLNYLRHHIKPRDEYSEHEAPQELYEKKKTKLPQYILINVRDMACKLAGVSVQRVNGVDRHQILVEVRQMVVYVGMELGFKPTDFSNTLKWDRTMSYQRYQKAVQLASTYKDYRYKLNQLAKRFGLNGFIA